MHDLSKTILRHVVPLCIHKLPIYLMCPHTLFFSSILDVISIVSACMIPLILSDSLSTSCYTQHCLQHACIAMNAAYRLAYPHNHKSHCHGVAIVGAPEQGRHFLLVSNICIAQNVTAHVTPSRDGSFFKGCFCFCSATHLCRHASAERGHRRRADGNGNDMTGSSMPRGHTARWRARLDTETAGQR